MRKQRCSAIEEQTTVHHHGSVVALRRKCGSGTEEGEPYAMVTDGLR
jgi:hypothetical protein